MNEHDDSVDEMGCPIFETNPDVVNIFLDFLVAKISQRSMTNFTSHAGGVIVQVAVTCQCDRG